MNVLRIVNNAITHNNEDACMAHTYRSLLDRVEIHFEEGRYRAVFRRVLQSLDRKPIERVYAKVDVQVFPDNPNKNYEYYNRYPIDISDLQFSAFTYFKNRKLDLDWKVRDRAPSRVELDIVMAEPEGNGEALFEGSEEVFVEYSFLASPETWGPYLERHVMRPIERLEVHISLPEDEFSVIEACRYAKPERMPINPEATQRTERGFMILDWACDAPTANDRFRFYWKFKDGRERRIQEEFEAQLKQARFITPDGKSVLIDGKEVRASKSQIACIKVMLQAKLDGELLEQAEIIRRAGYRSKKIQDIFKSQGAMTAAWSLIESPARGHFRLKDPEDI